MSMKIHGEYKYKTSYVDRRSGGKQPAKKKAFGQHFLRKQSVVDHMVERVSITAETGVLEIGCGDGFLTQAILEQSSCKKLLVYEIDPEWIAVVRTKITDNRLEIREQNILDVDLNILRENGIYEKKWVLLANLPYQITFPILFLLQKYRALFSQGVVMVQEEVAQKLVATHGKAYSATTIFLQQFFRLELMEKVEPQAFVPQPKIFSRLVYFEPYTERVSIEREEEFWKFVKSCFKTPRQTLKNNLRQTHYAYQKLSVEQLGLRAQQMSFHNFLDLWKIISE